MSTNNPSRPRMIPTLSRTNTGAPIPIFQPGPGARAREGGAPPNTGYNTSGPVNLQTGPVDYGGQHASLGRYRPPMFDLQGNPDPRDLGGYAYNLPNQYGPYPLNQYAGRFLAQDIYNNRALENMLANRQGSTSLIDMLRHGIMRMLASGPQAAYTVPPDQTQPVNQPSPAQPPAAEDDPYSSNTPYPPVQQGTPGRGGAGGPLPFLPGGMSGWTWFRRRRDDVAPMPDVWTA
ncbi:MAG: hypothetical protein QXW98_05780 [Candidatus Caldarchaeum sp.]